MWTVRFLAIVALLAAWGHMAWSGGLFDFQEVPDAFTNAPEALRNFSNRHRAEAKGLFGLPLITEIELAFALNLLGNYVLVVPVYTALRRWLRSTISSRATPETKESRLFLIDVATVSGIIYLAAGGIGAAILTRLYPLHIERHAAPIGSTETRAIESIHTTVVEMVHHGFWGSFETAFATFFFAAIAILGLSRSHSRSLAFELLTLILAVSNALVWIMETTSLAIPVHLQESVFMPALMAHLLLSPIWTVVAAFKATSRPNQPSSVSAERKSD